MINKVSTAHGLNPVIVAAILYQFKVTLNLSMGFSRLLQSQDLDEKSMKLYSKYINDVCEPSLDFVENLIDLMAIESDRISLNRGPCTLEKMLDETLFEFTARQSAESIKGKMPGLSKSTKCGDIHLVTDCKRLKQILMNLIANSFLFSDLPEIPLSCSVEGNRVKFFIHDNAAELRNMELDSILETYSQDKFIQNQFYIMAALRYEIAHKLAVALGGKLGSSKPGEIPSGVFFTIPYEKVERAEKKEARKTIKPAPSWSRYHALIVEDNKINHYYLTEVLKPTGIRTTWVQNGKEALEAVTSDPSLFNVILMDILMPEMDGFEASKLIKQVNKNLPIIAQTAYSLESESEESLMNFDGILTKPVWAADLINKLLEVLDD
jgi:CheY-like chemotaxis protein